MTELPVTWLVSRASGILALALLTLSVVAGLVLKTRPFGKLVKGVTAIEIHRALSIAGLAAIAVHGVALVLDRTVDITWADLLVPGASPYRPFWSALGVIAAELMVLLILSFRVRRLITVPVWRKLHYASYATFALAVLHGIFAGSDTSHRWMQYTYVAMIALVAGATAFRIVSPAPPRAAADLDRRPRPVPPPAPVLDRPLAEPAGLASARATTSRRRAASPTDRPSRRPDRRPR